MQMSFEALCTKKCWEPLTQPLVLLTRAPNSSKSCCVLFLFLIFVFIFWLLQWTVIVPSLKLFLLSIVLSRFLIVSTGVFCSLQVGWTLTRVGARFSASSSFPSIQPNGDSMSSDQSPFLCALSSHLITKASQLTESFCSKGLFLRQFF